MKNILLTGSNGFVGSYFINKYKKKYNIKTFSFLKDDLASFDCSNIDVVFHLSALVHQMGGANEQEYERVNVTQTLELANKAKASGVRHFIFMSTVKVYGEETGESRLPRFARNEERDKIASLSFFAMTEREQLAIEGEVARNGAYNENSECLPQDDYGKSKLKAEKELLKLEDKSFRVSIIRTPIVYGYEVKANIKNLVNLVNKVSILPFGGIDNRRSMVYVGNLCYMIDVLIGLRMERWKTDRLDCRASLAMTERIGSVFLASDDEAISTTRLIELIAKGLGRKVYLVKVPFFESFLKLVKPSFYKRLYGSLEVDNSITKQRLNLKNPYSVENGIKLMIEGEK